MPPLTFPITSDELTLAVIIGNSRTSMLHLLAAGQGLPRPIWTTGFVDTGTNITCISPAVLQKLGLAPTGEASSHTASGLVVANLFDVSLSIPTPSNVAGAMFTRNHLRVMEMPALIPGVDVLIGLDILLDCKLDLDGPARRFTIEF